MSEKEFRRSWPVLPIGTVMKLTNLSARQIRYYEAKSLVFPKRSESRHRLFSLNDIDRLLEIHDFLLDGWNISEIQDYYGHRTKNHSLVSDTQAREMLKDELLQSSRFSDERPHFRKRF